MIIISGLVNWNKSGYMPKIQGLVLAAGLSSRCVNNKLLVEVEGFPIIGKTIKILMSMGLASINVVLGSCGTEIRKALTGYPLQFIYNPDYRSGMGSSLKTGINIIGQDPSIDAILLMLGDMPLIEKSTVECLMTAYERERPLIIVPRFKGRRGHPVIFSREVLPILNHISGDQGAREIIDSRISQVHFIDIDDPGILIDLDTLEAIARHFPAT